MPLTIIKTRDEAEAAFAVHDALCPWTLTLVKWNDVRLIFGCKDKHRIGISAACDSAGWFKDHNWQVGRQVY